MSCRLLDQVPCFLYILPGCREISDGQPRDGLALKNGMRQKYPAGRVDALQNRQIFLSGTAITETNHGEGNRSGKLKVRVFFHQGGELPRPLDMRAKHGLDALQSKVAEHKPQF